MLFKGRSNNRSIFLKQFMSTFQFRIFYVTALFTSLDVVLFALIKKSFYFKCLTSSHCFYEQIDSSTPSSNLSVVSDIMKVGMLAVDIASQDEGSGVQSIDILYQKTSKGDGKFAFLLSFFLSLFSFRAGFQGMPRLASNYFVFSRS